MRIGEIINALEEWAPPGLQESYDNSGLIVGSLDWETTGVLVALDCLESVLDEAIEKKVQCIYMREIAPCREDTKRLLKSRPLQIFQEI